MSISLTSSLQPITVTHNIDIHCTNAPFLGTDKCKLSNPKRISLTISVLLIKLGQKKLLRKIISF